MPNYTQHLQALAESARQRIAAVVENPELLREPPLEYLPAVVGAVITGVVMAKTEPGLKPKRPRLAKNLKVGVLATMTAGVAAKPVRGSIELASALVRAPLVKLVHNRVTGKPSRFILTAALIAVVGVAEVQAKKWAAQQPQLQELEKRGLAARADDHKSSADNLAEELASLRRSAASRRETGLPEHS